MASWCTALVFLLAQAPIIAQTYPSIEDRTDLSPRGSCAHIEIPFAFWQIYQESSRQSETDQLGPYCSLGPPYCAEQHSYFNLSQGANAANQHDLVASYRNQLGPADSSCPAGEIHGPYTLEFQYDPKDPYTNSGTNKRIVVFDINGDIPQQFDGH